MGKRKGINGKQTVFIQGWFLYGKCINFNNCSPSKAPVKSLTRRLFCLQLTQGMAQVNYPQSFCSTMFWEVGLKLSHCSCGKHIFDYKWAELYCISTWWFSPTHSSYKLIKINSVPKSLHLWDWWMSPYGAINCGEIQK